VNKIVLIWNLGEFLINNYKSALLVVNESHRILEATKSIHPTFHPDTDCPLWLNEERQYLSTLKSEPFAEKSKIQYLDALEDMELAEYVCPIHYRQPIAKFTIRLKIKDLLNNGSTMQTNAQTMKVIRARQSVEEARSIVSNLAHLHSFDESWEKGSAPRVEAEGLRNNQKYHRLLDDLEHRALSRRLEVEKLGLPNTGMCI